MTQKFSISRTRVPEMALEADVKKSTLDYDQIVELLRSRNMKISGSYLLRPRTYEPEQPNPDALLLARLAVGFSFVFCGGLVLALIAAWITAIMLCPFWL